MSISLVASLFSSRYPSLLRPSVSAPSLSNGLQTTNGQMQKLSLSSLEAILYDELGVSLVGSHHSLGWIYICIHMWFGCVRNLKALIISQKEMFCYIPGVRTSMKGVSII